MARAKQKRRFSTFSLSFLDVMSCGFGAVVLIFLVINHNTEYGPRNENRELLAEARKLDYQIEEGQRNLTDLHTDLEDSKQRVGEATRELLAMLDDLKRKREELEELQAETMAREESTEALDADVKLREQEVERLKALERASAGRKIREIRGEGDRQYLTGLRIGGKHVLIVLDVSASMLDRTIVQVIRRRNMSAERQRNAPKWQRALRTVEWLAAQIPLESHFQMMSFAEEAHFLIGDGEWVVADNPDVLDKALRDLGQSVPKGGTNLAGAFDIIADMNPLPDNMYLITDGLPTQDDKPPKGATVTGRQRLRLFENAARRMPNQVPLNVIMFPMEGDPSAAGAFWLLAHRSGGTFLSPSRDWP